MEAKIKNCKVCGKQFSPRKKEGVRDWTIRKFCSIKCAYEGIDYTPQRNRILTNEEKQKISAVNKHHKYWLGKKHSLLTKQKISKSNTGKKRTEEWKQNHSKKITAENNPRWKGGTWNYLKPKVLLRDKYTCQNCGLEEGRIMEIDHIRPKKLFPELQFNIDNLMTLCPNCHRRKHLQNSNKGD